MKFIKLTKSIAFLLAIAIFFSTMAFAANLEPNTFAVRGLCAQEISKGLSVQDIQIMKGDASGNMRENEPVKRVEVFIMLSRALPLLDSPDIEMNFPDVPDWAKKDIGKLYSAGIVKGFPNGLFGSDQHITVKQLYTIIERAKNYALVNARDDFYQGINEKWLRETELSRGSSSYNSMDDANETNSTNIKNILNSCIKSQKRSTKGTDEQRIADFYECAADIESRNNTGITPIKPYLDKIDNAKTVKELLDADAAIVNNIGFSTLFSSQIDRDSLNNVTLYFLGMSTIQTKEQNESLVSRSTLNSYLINIFKAEGKTNEEAAKLAESAAEVERFFNQNEMSATETTDLMGALKNVSKENFKTLFGEIDIEDYYSSIQSDFYDTVAMFKGGDLKSSIVYLNNRNLSLLKAHARALFLSKFDMVMTSKFFDAAIAYSNKLNGTSGSPSPSLYALNETVSALSIPFEKMYIDRYFSKDAKADVTQMVEKIIHSYEDILTENQWLSPETKQKAIEKLNAITLNIGYPDEWEDLSATAAVSSKNSGGSLLSNVISISVATYKESLRMVKENIPSAEFGMPVYAVNAFYSPADNSINFPAGILQSPVYNIKDKFEDNYARIGFVIAHEVSHAFDPTGALYDAEGNRKNWWTKEDKETFDKNCKKLSDFFHNKVLEDKAIVNGPLVVNEAVADLAAMQCILRIIKSTPKADYNRFFQKYAVLWREVDTAEYLELITKSDTHLPSKLRVNGIVQHFDEFYQTYDIKSTNGMYIPPEERIHIW